MKSLVNTVLASIVLVALVPLAVHAGAVEEKEGPGELPSYGDNANKSWQEQAIPIPHYPVGAKLLPIQTANTPSNYSYLLDPGSISVGADGVVRYTVVIKPPAAHEVARYEGLRCTALDYRLYAVGIDRRFVRVPGDGWHRVQTEGSDAYRGSLLTDYLCGSSGWPLKREQILSRLRRGRLQRDTASAGGR